MSYSTFEIISQIIVLLSGGALGGGAITFFTMRAQRKKANAEAQTAEASADSAELDNVEKAIKIWREMAETLKTELQESRDKYADVTKQVQDLKRTVDKLNMTNTKILKLLEKISPDNIEEPVEQIKKEIHNARA
jgi:chromosome segregation ATPase